MEAKARSPGVHACEHLKRFYYLSLPVFINKDLQLCSSQKFFNLQASILKLMQLILTGIEKTSREWQELMELACQLGSDLPVYLLTITAESQIF